MDITNPFKMMLKSSTVPGVTIVQNGCQKKWLLKAVFGYNLKIIDIESWIFGHNLTNNCDIIIYEHEKYF